MFCTHKKTFFHDQRENTIWKCVVQNLIFIKKVLYLWPFWRMSEFTLWCKKCLASQNAIYFFLCLPMALSNCCAFISSFDIGALGLTFRLFLGFIVELLQDIFGICWLMLSGLERSRDPFNSNLVGVFKRGILVKCGPAYLEKNWMKKFTYQRKHKMIYILDTRNAMSKIS